MRKLILLLILIPLFISSCKRDTTPQPQTGTPIVMQDLTAYSYFKKGTYWIYKDSATSVLDSVYVYGDTTYSYYQNNNIQKAGNYMFYDFQAHSYFDTYNYEYSISMGNYSITDGHRCGVERTRLAGLNTGSTYLMSNEFVGNIAFANYLSPGTITFQGFYDSININGLFYKNVVHFHDTGNASEIVYTVSYGYQNPTTDFYIGKNTGIVKKKIVDTRFNTINKTWNLIRYHINQ